MFYMIYLSAKISHWNWLVTSTLEFWGIKYKNLKRLRWNLKKQANLTLWFKLGELVMEYVSIFAYV